MAASKLKAAILIISDTAYRDPSTDKAGSALTQTFAVEGGDKWDDPAIVIVPDNVVEIQRQILSWTDVENYFNLIITTGGTGFAVKDNTPEVGIRRESTQAPLRLKFKLRISIEAYLFISRSNTCIYELLTNRHRPYRHSYIGMHLGLCKSLHLFSAWVSGI